MSTYTSNIQERIADLFVGVVAENAPSIASCLQKKLSVLRNPMFDEAQRRAAVEALFQEVIALDPPATLAVAEMDAKLIDVQWRARKTAGICVVNAVAQTRQIRTGDTFSELIERLCRKNLSAAAVQSLLYYAHIWPSLTTHPTNPTSLAYTRVGMQLDRILAEPSTTTTRIVAALRAIRDTSMEFDVDDQTHARLVKKTPKHEMNEVLGVLNVIYDSVVGPQHRLREALDRFGYQDVKCDAPLLNMNIWGAGDGDGNPNMDYKYLKQQVQLLRHAIRKRYVNDLQNSAVDLSNDQFGVFTAQKELIISQLLQNKYATADALLSDITLLQNTLINLNAGSTAHAFTSTVAPDVLKAIAHLDDVLIKCRTFGLRFAGTDVRHNSVDIMEAAASLLVSTNVISDKSAFLQLSSNEQTSIMRRVLDDAVLRDSVRKMSFSEVEQKFGEVGARVFLRMRVIAKHPDMFQKLIIAETRSAANAVAAMLLLRYAGNTVAEAGATINIVPLFESRQDLEEAPLTFHTLATDPTFGCHIKHVGCFVAMIAKSDTTRLSGPGVQGRQEETVGRLMAVNPDSYGGGFDIHIFVGGGDDQMRGGGRIVETPHVLMLAGSRLGATKPARFAMTVQGLQMQLVFGSRLLSEHFFEAFAAQQMLAAARLEGLIRYRPVPAVCNRKAADQAAHDFFADAMDRYERRIGAPNGTPDEVAHRQSIVAYLNGFPASIITSGNKSSRPMARKKTVDPLQGRAISLDQLSKHDGSYITATLGVADALEAMHNNVRCGAPEKDHLPLSPLRHAYLANKSFRDFVRMQAVVLHQKDYSVSWKARGGQPTEAELQALATAYEVALKAHKAASPREFLAHTVIQDRREAWFLVVAITGSVPTASVSVRDPLSMGWPDLAAKMSGREAQGVLSQHFVNAMVQKLQNMQSDGVDLQFAQQLAYYGYVGVNPKFSTPSFSLSMTDPQKEGSHSKTSETSPEIAAKLITPLWARANAKL